MRSPERLTGLAVFRRVPAVDKCQQQVVTAIARELLGYIWEVTNLVKVA